MAARNINYWLTIIAGVALCTGFPGNVTAAPAAKPAKPAPPLKPVPPPKAAPDAPAAPAALVAPSTLKKLLDESEAAFEAKEFLVAAPKIEELLKAIGTGSTATPEMKELLHFNVGLAYLLGEKPAEAEAAFGKCAEKFPKGDYASRCQLGIGRACVNQATPEKKTQAIKALKLAMADRKYRSEAGLLLGRVYIDLDKREEALGVFRKLMGSDIRSLQQTTAAVEVIGLLADSGNLDDLVYYLDSLANQAGVRDAISWFTNQVLARGDAALAAKAYETALAIYQAVPPRSQIMETQTLALEIQRKKLKLLEATLTAEKDKPIIQRTNASELVGSLKPAIELSQAALTAIEEKADLDAALLMRRGRCLYYLDRLQEALVCFRTLRTKYTSATDAKAAAYAEIIIYSQLKDIAELQTLCPAYRRAYPDADNAEQVSTLEGELLVQDNKWSKVGKFYQQLESRFPKSENLDRYVFFQAAAHFQDANFAESTPLLERFIKNYPNSKLFETALYYLAMANFLSNEYKKTLVSCNEYLKKFPDGRFAGDMRYRLAFIDFNDKDVDQSDKIIRDLSGFLKDNPDDLAKGSILCLMADTYKKKNDEASALEAYKKAAMSESPDDVIQYALDTATTMLQGKKNWDAIAELHEGFLKAKPESSLALLSATWVAKGKTRSGKVDEARVILANALKANIANPNNEQVEFLMDELVKTMAPKKKIADEEVEVIDKQLVDLLNTVIGGEANPTANARLYYARARLGQLLKRSERSDRFLKGIATSYAEDPSVLSPALLAACGDILLKGNNLDGAQAMFKRLSERYKTSMFSDAGPVGLGFVALAQKNPEEALKIFEDVLLNNPGTSRFKETTLGKLQALVELGQYEPATKMAVQIVGDKSFRGETSGKAYLMLGQVYRKQAAKGTPPESTELLKKAHATYQRVYVAYQGNPDICAEAYWQAYEVAKELHEDEIARKTLKDLAEHKKLQNTARAKEAKKNL